MIVRPLISLNKLYALHIIFAFVCYEIHLLLKVSVYRLKPPPVFTCNRAKHVLKQSEKKELVKKCWFIFLKVNFVYFFKLNTFRKEGGGGGRMWEIVCMSLSRKYPSYKNWKSYPFFWKKCWKQNWKNIFCYKRLF